MNLLAADRDYYGQEESNLYNREYGAWGDQRNYDTTQYWNETNYGYQKDRDAVADSQWQKEYDALYGGTNGSGSGGTGGGAYDNAGYSTKAVKEAQDFVGADVDGMWGSQSAAKAKAMGYNSIEDVMKAIGIKHDVNVNQGTWDTFDADSADKEEKDQYAGWGVSEWEAYFAHIRQSEGQSAAETELNRMTQAGLIPQNMVTAAALGARGGRLGH